MASNCLMFRAAREFDRHAAVTIQGGGLYGLSLLGQLRAVEENGIQPIALAGTSAGAIVATLFWAGLSTEEIRDHFILLATQDGGLASLLGPYTSSQLPVAGAPGL
jgi:predicted acylesterase/phospholipase RssA